MVMDGTQIQEGATTSPADAETSKDTFSKDEVAALVAKVRSDSLAEVGRVRKAAEEGIKRATESVTTLYTSILSQERADAEAIIADQPDALTAMRERRGRRQTEIEKAQLKAELDAANARLTEATQKEVESQRDVFTQSIATTFGVDSATLGRLAKHTDGSKEAIEDIAKDLPKLTGNSPGGGRPDSTQTRGGSKGLTKADVAKWSPEERSRRSKEIAALSF